VVRVYAAGIVFLPLCTCVLLGYTDLWGGLEPCPQATKPVLSRRLAFARPACICYGALYFCQSTAMPQRCARLQRPIHKSATHSPVPLIRIAEMVRYRLLSHCTATTTGRLTR